MRFANLLRATRLEHGTSFRSLVKAGGQQWTKDQLRQIEDGLLTLDESMVESVSMAYGADLGSILPSRLAVDIVEDGVISAGGVRAVFIPHNETSLLTAYLRLIRTMRRQRKAPMIALRRDDIEVLAAHLEMPGETVVDRLTALMGATLHQRTAIASMFAMGAVVIGLAGATVAGAPDNGTDIVNGKDPNPAAVVEVVQSTDRVVPAVDRTETTVAAADPGSIPAADAVTATTSGTASEPSTSAPAVVSPAASPATVAVGKPVVPQAGAVTPSAATPATVTPSTVEVNAGDPPLVPVATPTTASEPIVATDDPPVPPTSVVDPGSAEPPIVPSEPLPDPTASTTTTIVDVGPPPVPPTTGG
jgi:hypothetical protein